MNHEEVLFILQRLKAIITDSHIVYTSGKHGSIYINKDALYPHTKETSRCCQFLAEEFASEQVDIVVAPALGGIILSQWVAYHLSQIYEKEVLAIYAEKTTQGDGFVIRRGYDQLLPQKKILILEDVLTTGGSVKKVVEIVRRLGATIVGVGALCNRGGVTAKDIGNVPRLVSLLNLSLETYEPYECPLCIQKIPINPNVGKGQAFLTKQ
jgi:orotate phosphoribosyltransferase